jgi:FkbM family methyltransferase
MKAVLEHYLRPGYTFIDMGANEGYFSVVASHLVGPRGSVIAVEPQSRLQHILQTNLRLNRCYNVRLIGAAISSTSGPVKMNLTADINSGGSSLFRPTKYGLRTEEVDGFTLSEFCRRAGLDRCDLMKVDIEGAEYDVFMGARDFLQTGIIRNIALEIHNSILEKRGLSGNDLHHELLEARYDLNADLGNWVYSFKQR